jgi:uncharacterized membrane protein
MTRKERAAINAAIGAAEVGTSGCIAVRVIPDVAVDALHRAKHEFARLRLHRHGDANAALILVAPKARQFAIIGDRALHARVGEAFWHDLIAQSRPYFARGAITDGIIYAVGRIGEALHSHFAEGAPD